MFMSGESWTLSVNCILKMIVIIFVVTHVRLQLVCSLSSRRISPLRIFTTVLQRVFPHTDLVLPFDTKPRDGVTDDGYLILDSWSSTFVV